jgi:type 1 glutamine amidotransferase
MAATNIILTGGINHEFEDAANALAEVLSGAGIDSEIYPDIDEGFAALSSGTFNLVTLLTLRWRMLDDEKYIPHRNEWAYEISEENQQLLVAHISTGGGLLGLHTACICFDTWPEWPEILGAQWVWGHTWHPPPAKIQVTGLNQAHPATRGISDFTVTDEIYHNVLANTEALPLFGAQSAEEKTMQTLAWAHRYGEARVIFDALGHDRASITAPGHAQFLQQAARWCTGVIN